MKKYMKSLVLQAVSSIDEPHTLFGFLMPKRRSDKCLIAVGLSVFLFSGCANQNGYNGQPCYPYNAYPYAPQPQYGVPGTFQPGGVYPAPGTGVPMNQNLGAPIGSPGVMPGANYPAGIAPSPGYNNVPAFNGQPNNGPGQPFIGS